MNYAALIDQIYSDVDADRLEKAVMDCVRLARNLKDYLNAAVFLRELYPKPSDFNRAFAEDTVALRPEVGKMIFQRSAAIFIEGRTLPFAMGASEDGEEQNILGVSAGELDTETIGFQKSIEDLSVPAGMTPFDTAAFADSFARQKSTIRLRIKANEIVRHRLKARCFNYAVSIERQLGAQQKPAQFVHLIQNDVNNYFKARSEDVYSKLQKASQLVTSNDPEANALLLTEVRRSIKAVADHLYPASHTPVECSDGQARKLDDERYLNRLEEFVSKEFSGGTSSELLNAELKMLIAFARKLNKISSKGVHAEVTGVEARQGLLGLYMFLYNLISKLQNAETPEPPST